MKPSTRAALAADLDAIAAVESAWPTAAGWTRDQFADELLRDESRLIVAEQDGIVAGFAAARFAAGEAQILDIAVSPFFVRRGLGRLLLDDLLARARREGFPRATLEARSDNAAALALYRRAGFKVVGTRPKFYNGVSDAVLMDLDLA